MTPHAVARQEPGLLDGLSLLGQTVDELVVRPVRDTHSAVVRRVHKALPSRVRPASDAVGLIHRVAAASGYGAASLGLRLTSAGLQAAAGAGVGVDLERGAKGRFVRSSTNGLFGHRLVAEHPRLAITMAVRHRGADVPLTRAGLSAAYPDATDRAVVFLPGLCESEDYWDFRRDPAAGSYPEQLADLGWTPVRVRANSGLSLRENGIHLAALLQDLVDHWPTGRPRLALIGHSMGGLIIRAATAVRLAADYPWSEAVSDVITLGTPHLGAPMARGIEAAAQRLSQIPETAPLGAVLGQVSHGVSDLTEGLADEVPALPGVRYHTVLGTVTRNVEHPVGRWLGDLLVRPDSARGRMGPVELFPGGSVLEVPSTEHFSLLNHPAVASALRDWLS